MTHDEPWQVYHPNGDPLAGVGLKRVDLTNDLIMGAAHIWVWCRRSDGMVRVMVQKRAATKSTWPGYYDISAAGHINKGETPVESALREAREEIGLGIDPDKLFYIFSLRTPLSPNEINHVYLYETTGEFVPAFDDGEVELAEWFSVDELKKAFSSPEDCHFVDQGEDYFSLLMTHLERL